MRLAFVFSEIGNGLRRNLSMTISVVLVTMVSLLFLGLGLLGQSQASSLKDYWFGKIEVSVYMCPQSGGGTACTNGPVTAAQSDQIKSELDSMKPLVSKVYYESSQQAFDRFKKQYKDMSLADNVNAKQMPSSYRVKLSDPKQFATVSSAFEGAPGVYQVQDQSPIVKKLFSALHALSVGAWVLAAVMIIGAILLVGTTVRLSAWGRRRETGIMRLVGASNIVIQLPFVLETLIATVVGTALAIGVLWVIVRYGVGYLTDLVPYAPLVGTGNVVALAPWLGLVGVVMAVLAASLTLRRYLRV